MKNRTTSQTTGPDKKAKRVTSNTTPGVKANGTKPASNQTMEPVSIYKKRSKIVHSFTEPISELRRTEKIIQKPYIPVVDAIESGMKGAMIGGIQKRIDDRMQNGINYNNIPFKNKAIDVLKRRKYDISSEFDGQEVQGTMTERPTVGGGMVETERYNMPSGGSRMERTRYNQEGQPVNRVIRDKKINPR
jgi:hypothetical protein